MSNATLRSMKRVLQRLKKIVATITSTQPRKLEAISEIVKTAAIICAGVWAIHTFSAKREASIAEASYAKLQLENAETERKKKEFVTAGIINESVQKTDDGYLLVLRLHITNKGATDHDLNLDDRTVRLARIGGSPNDSRVLLQERQFSSLYTLPTDHPDRNPVMATPLTLKGGADANYLCFFRVVQPGVYYAEFKAHYQNAVLFSNTYIPVGLSNKDVEGPENRESKARPEYEPKHSK